MRRIFFFCVMVLAFRSVPASGMLTEDIMIPTECRNLFGTSTYRLATYIHKPDDFDPSRKYPVVIISHGSAPDAYTRTHARFSYPNASEYFLKKGFIAVVPMRRGYAGSDGASIADAIGSCSNPDYAAAAREGARDIAAVIAFVKGLGYADAHRILLAGTSAGGFASLAAARSNIEGVIGVINFSGGQGGSGRSEPPGHACHEQRLIEVMGSFGATKVPTLWIYSEDDAFFGPELARAMFDDFSDKGGKGALVITPPFGHALLSREGGKSLWAPHCDQFLDALDSGSAMPTIYGKKTH